MAVLFSNNATSRLVGAITASQTTIEVADASGFPSPTGGDWFPVTLEKIVDGLYVREITHCTARAGNVLTVARAQEGTAGTTFTANDRAESRLTAGALAQIEADSVAYTDTSFATRTLTAGDGISGGGTLDADRAFAVDNTVVRTGRTLTAGNGITGGGTLAANRTFTLGTPSSLNGASTNAVTADSHTHAISLTPADVGSPPNARTITAGDGLSGGGDLSANRAFAVDSSVVRTTRTLTAGNGLTGGGTLAANRAITLGAPGTLDGGTSNGVTASSHTHAINATDSRTSSSTATLLNAKAMNDHRTSGDHDSRYPTTSATNLGATSGTGLRTITSAAEWAALPVGYCGFLRGNDSSFVGAPVSNFGYFSKTANRDTHGGWSGIWIGHSNNQHYFGRALTSNELPTWEQVLISGSSGSGSGLTGLNASNLASGTVPIARISSTSSRTSSSTTSLLQAKAMNDHRTSGDHDARYALKSGGANANFTTMPQVGGDPVVESGSNSDGEWTRWADGTQHVSKGLYFTAENNFTVAQTVNSPVAFQGTARFQVTCPDEEANFGVWFGSGQMQTTTQGYCRLRTHDNAERSGAFTVSIFLSGRWK